MPIIIVIATFLSTLLGGLFALKFRDRLHLILGFSAGAVIGVAFFDLLPEAIDLGSGKYSVGVITSVVALGFAIYMILDRMALLHSHEEESLGSEAPKLDSHRGKLGAGSLSIHSFLDGVAIGLSFQVSAAVGLVVTLAVLAHDFSDGINTVNMIVKNGGTRAMRWLVVDAAAPVVGIIATLFFTLPESALGAVLAVFTGFFIYIGASDLIPESHHGHPKVLTTVMTILGAVILYLIVGIARV